MIMRRWPTQDLMLLESNTTSRPLQSSNNKKCELELQGGYDTHKACKKKYLWIVNFFIFK